MTKSANSNRILSLDVFRGFDMMFIMGLYGVCTGIVGLFGITDPKWVFLDQFYHVSWNGFHFIDSIFPTFLFIAGVSFPFSLAEPRSSASLRSCSALWGVLYFLYRKNIFIKV